MKREALVVGINRYAHHSDLDRPVSDAEAIAQLLEQPTGDLAWNVSRLPEFYPDGKPQVEAKGVVNQDQLTQAITDLLYPKNNQIPEVALLFFAGHGFRKEYNNGTEGFLAATNTKPNAEKPERAGISLNWLREQLINSPVTKQIIWLDCCHSGELLNFLTEAELQNWLSGGDRCLIAACRSDRTAFGVDEHGVLTTVLLQALDPKLYPEGQWISSGTVTDFVEQQREINPLLKRQIPLCRNFGERIRLWRGTRRVEGVPVLTKVVDMDIDVLVQQVRQRLHDKVQSLHGTMQLLDVAHPVDIDRLYVDVNILTQPTSYTRLEISELLRGCDYRKDFNRFGLSQVRERVAGLQAVTAYPKLMVLGKPGAGKTTFLQHVVIECNKGNFLTDKVPILVKLRDFFIKAKKTGDFSLESYIRYYLRGCTQPEVTALLEAGKVLLLLDGLDEVPGADGNAVVNEIKDFIDNYEQNNLIITCRIQACKYKFERFFYLEIADFNSEQIVAFVRKWFLANDRHAEHAQHIEVAEGKAQQLFSKLNLPDNQQIRELAVTPILLSLTCKVFDDKGNFYSKPAELYEQGLEILLSKWDESRDIQRERVYRELTVGQKQALLCYIAVRKFEQEQYVLFEEREIQEYIVEYLGIPLEDSQGVLEAIEAQHGLLIERAQRIYSFSHLTFQEYFTAKFFVDSAKWCNLVSHITDKHWWQVFFLAINMMQFADDILRLMKQKVERIVASDDKLQQFLIWLTQKSISVKRSYNLTSIRAFYFAIASHLDFDCTLAHTLCPHLDTDFEIDRRHDIEFTLNLGLDFALIRAIDCAIALQLTSISRFDFDFDFSLDLGRFLTFNTKLAQALQQLNDSVPKDKDGKTFKQWWKANGKPYIEELRYLAVNYRNIGHDWQFTNQQKKCLQQYYDANKLLVNCLKSNLTVSTIVREEIEDTLLLPITELRK